jgi:hypothetical protein
MCEVKNRNEAWIGAVKHVREAQKLLNSMIEYPEMNALALELEDAVSGAKTRITSMAKTSDKNLLIRVHQIDSIEI